MDVDNALNGGGVESMQAKWDEVFGKMNEIVDEEVKAKKQQRKVTSKKASKKKPVKNRISKKKIAK